MEPKLKTVLYLVQASQIPYIVDQAVTHAPDLASSGDLQTDALIAGIRVGRRVQAVTALHNGTVLFALNSDGQ